jgi:hypothetical protein
MGLTGLTSSTLPYLLAAPLAPRLLSLLLLRLYTTSLSIRPVLFYDMST